MINDVHEFCQRIREERSRSDRSGLPFSLIIISLENIPTDEARTLTRAIVKFDSKLRLSDVMGWYDRKVLGIILPGAREEEARNVLNRLKSFVISSNKALNVREIIKNDGNFTIMEYPRDVWDCLWNGGNNPDQNNPGNNDDRNTNSPLSRYKFLERSSLLWRKHRTENSLLFYDVSKRLIDLILGSMLLLAFLPLMLLIALLIKTTSRGPVLYRQTRIGRFGREFTFYKFRTMYHNCDEKMHRDYVLRLIKNRAEKKVSNNRSYFKLVDDPRITPLGRILRKTSLDELPQLFNVLKGDMSLVGPRPPIPYEVEQYDVWQLRRVLDVKPGLTGLWQVSGRASTTFDEQVRLDLRYVANHSLWMDILILLRTFKAVCNMEGAA
jgi:lipopolysaccharide/colanic/teichoic acid biosynthesis glycosyltransferase